MSTILVVDDELTVRSLLHDILDLEGYVVREAEDGPAALFDMHTKTPDLVILDVMMPRMSGIEVLKEIRQDVELARVPVLMLTAAGDDDTTWAGWSSGASTYLNKPFDHEELLSWVERLLTPPDTTIVAEKPVFQLATTV
jgi:two-component system phosphate regulon response regulator PhoB